jgi:hypothetical protein
MTCPTIATFAFGDGNPSIFGALLLHYSATVYLTGAIWFVQAVHYPLFRNIAPVEFFGYYLGHQKSARWVLVPGMLLEAASALLLVYLCPQILSQKFFAASLLLLGVIWFSTIFLNLPAHRQLRREGNGRRLVAGAITTNWVRTIAWSLRSLLLAAMLLQQGTRATAL